MDPIHVFSIKFEDFIFDKISAVVGGEGHLDPAQLFDVFADDQ